MFVCHLQLFQRVLVVSENLGELSPLLMDPEMIELQLRTFKHTLAITQTTANLSEILNNPRNGGDGGSSHHPQQQQSQREQNTNEPDRLSHRSCNATHYAYVVIR